MASRILQRMARAVVLAGLTGITLASVASATRPERPNRPRARGFNLFAGAINVRLQVNRVQCNINNLGEACVDPLNSSTIGGGFWPKGSPDQYIFNSGLQIAAFNGGTKTATFPWPGDTIGAFFFDPRGDQTMGEGRTNVFSSLNADDKANWPSAAFANDTSIFDASLIGRQNVSQQDTWTRFWDGNTTLSSGARKHPMGLLVEQRGMAWNFPSGNEDIIYFIVRFINITSGNLADYAGLAASGYSASDIQDIYNIALDFRARSQAAYNVTIPAGGFPWTNVYASYAEDADVGNASINYSNANLIFNMAMAYKADFHEATWQLPPSIFAAPFAAAPGFTSIKYLATPGGTGIAIAGNTTNGSVFPDAVGVSRLWRNLSGNLLPADGTCSVPNPTVRHFCQWVQVTSDTRFYASSGPFTVSPGQLATIVVALVHAAPVGTSPAATPPFGPALPAFSLTPFINGDMKPGLSIDGARLRTGADTIRNLDRAAGWLNHGDANNNGTVEQSEVITVPRSLYGKALVAQSVFDKKFLLPSAPEAPSFFLVPGDNQVTVAWRPSLTDSIGDPYFTVASSPLNPNLTVNTLYDPDFRKFDVEGYRIWRGRTQSEMVVIAAFDKVGSTFVDYTAEYFDPAVYGNACAPELGVTTSCPVAFENTPPGGVQNVNKNTSPHFDAQLNGLVQQVASRVQLANGTIFNVAVDTAVIGGNSGFPGLSDTGVPFAYTDATVRNGFRYIYSVTAFDVNSIFSGPSSLESPLITKEVTPRAPSGQTVAGTGLLGSPVLLAADTSVLNPAAALPTISATTGIFSGPMPPTDGITIGFAAFLPQVLSSGSFTVTIDSIVPGATDLDFTIQRNGTYYLTAQGSAPTPVKFSIPFSVDIGSGTTSANGAFQATNLSTAQSARFGGDSTFAAYGNATLSFSGGWRLTGYGRGEANGAPANSAFNGPRWWTGGANENTNDPNGGNCAPSSGGCVAPPTPARTAGGLGAGITVVNIQAYNTVNSVPQRDFETITAHVVRAADMKVFWGAAGAIDSVVDVTHKVRVPFKPGIRASWGILNDSSFTNTPAGTTPDGNNALLTWTDIYCVDPVPTYLTESITPVTTCGGPANPVAFLMNHARLGPIAAATSAFTAPPAASTGNGFIFYLNGHFFLMQMAALPAAGTVWNARFYAGTVTGSAAGSNFAFTPETRPPAVPGLRVRLAYTALRDTTISNDSVFANIHTVPDPYYVTNALELAATTKVLRFVNIPSQAVVRIYSASGVLVNVLTHNDATGGSEVVWNLRNRNNQFVASGVYFYHVEAADGRTKVGRFTVVNFAQ